MKNSEISINSKTCSNLISTQEKITCDKCGGSGNLKTPENSRRTCLACYGKGFIN